MSTVATEEKPVGVAAMAEYLNKSEYTIREYAKTKRIPGHKLDDAPRAPWFFYISEVRDHLTARVLETVQSPQSRGRKRAA